MNASPTEVDWANLRKREVLTARLVRVSIKLAHDGTAKRIYSRGMDVLRRKYPVMRERIESQKAVTK